MIPNAPPVEAMGMHIDDLYDEAKGILDGAGVKSDADTKQLVEQPRHLSCMYCGDAWARALSESALA